MSMFLVLNRQLISNYKKIKYFNWNKVPFTEDEEFILKLATGGFYNGFLHTSYRMI